MRYCFKLNKNGSLNIIINQILQSDIGSRMAKGTFWTLTGTVFGKLMILIAGIFCARIIGKSEYGQLGMILSTINMFVVIGAAGLGTTATKYISEFREINKNKASSIYLLTNWFAVVTGLLVTVSIIFFAPFLATKTLNAPFLTNGIRMGGLMLFIAVVNSAQNGVLSGFEDFKSISINCITSSFIQAVFMILGAVYYGVIGAVLGYGIGFFALALFNYSSIKKDMNLNGISRSIYLFKTSDLNILYKFSLPAALSSFLVAPVFWCIRSMLVKNVGFAEVGLYEAADQWKIIILFIPAAK